MFRSVITRIVNFALQRKEPADAAEWHPWNTLLRVRLVDGTRKSELGKLYRRWNGAGWEYKYTPETEEELLDRIDRTAV